ncbi:hypothetical protein Hanom_Chr02g00165601 [Helianthus anomalus]
MNKKILGEGLVTGSKPAEYTRVFYYSAFTPESFRLLWRVQLLAYGSRLEILSGSAKPNSDAKHEPG